MNERGVDGDPEKDVHPFLPEVKRGIDEDRDEDGGGGSGGMYHFAENPIRGFC